MPTEHSDTTIDMQELVRSHRVLVARALARAGVAERDIPDLVQEVFIVAHRRLPEWEGRAKLSTWLYRVAVRIASDHRRRAYQRHEALPGLDCSTLEAPATQQPVLERREQLLQLCAALDQLSAEHKQTLVGYEIEELTVAELAERTQVPHKTIYSRLYAARSMLRRLLLAQGWTLLTGLIYSPKRCLAAWRIARSSAKLMHAPLACCLLLLTPDLQPQPSTAPAAATHHSQFAKLTPPAPNLTPALAIAPAQPSAASPRRRKRLNRGPAAASPAQKLAPAMGLKVIHVGSVERPEGPLPFGFERVVEHAGPRLSLSGPRDPVESIPRELL